MATEKIQRLKIRKYGFLILAHPSDIGLRIRAKTVRQLFQYSVYGLYYLFLGHTVMVKMKKVRKKVIISGLDLEQLLVKLLNEIIFCLTVKREFWNNLKIRLESYRKLTAVFSGYLLATGNIFHREIKAATYQGLQIVHRKKVFAAKIIFDT